MIKQGKTPRIWDPVALAAQLWCREDTGHIEMDCELAQEFATRIANFEEDLVLELIDRTAE